MTHARAAVSLVAALLAAALLGPAAARADVAPMPTVLHLEGQRSAVTTRGGPDHALFSFRNTHDRSAEVFLYRAVLRVDGMNVPMEITRVEVDGRAQDDSRVRVPANGRVSVAVFFALPEAHRSRSSWDVDLRVTTEGLYAGWDSSPAHITRARRRPRDRKWVTGPKDRAATRRAPPT